MSSCILNFNQIKLLYQKSDSEHRDNDWMNIIWTINAIAARVDTLPLSDSAGSTVLGTGSVIPSFSKQLDCKMGDLVIATYFVQNLGNIDDVKKQAEAAANIGQDIAQKFAEIYLKVAQIVLQSGVGELLDVPQALSNATADVLKAFQDKIIEEIGNAFQDILIPILDKIADLYGLATGKPNCNGDVFHDTVTFPYTGTAGYGYQFTKVYSADHVTGCGTAAETSVDISLSRMEDAHFGTNVPPATFIIYGITAGGDLMWYNHAGHDNGTPDWNTLNKPVGIGWQNFRHVFSGGEGIIYAIQNDGTLLWYGNNADGNTVKDSKFRYTDLLEKDKANFIGPKAVGSGWQNMINAFADGSGIIYAVTQEGTLLWFRHHNYLTGDEGGWEGPKNIGEGWQQFSHLFSGRNGVIYAITGRQPFLEKAAHLPAMHQETEPASKDVIEVVKQNLNPVTLQSRESQVAQSRVNYNVGDLIWYVHTGFATGENSWLEPKTIGNGWQTFTHCFSDGNDIIYGALGEDMPPFKKGDLIWYKYDGYINGTAEWEPRKKVSTGGGWNDFKFLFGNIYFPPPPIA